MSVLLLPPAAGVRTDSLSAAWQCSLHSLGDDEALLKTNGNTRHDEKEKRGRKRGGCVCGKQTQSIDEENG